MRVKKSAEGGSVKRFIVDDEKAKELIGKSVNGVFNFNPTDDNGFDRRNTNIYLKKGESAEFVILPYVVEKVSYTKPFYLMMHDLVMTTKSGKKYYPKEICLKHFYEEETECLLSDASLVNSEVIRPARPAFFQLVLDMRGKRTEHGFDGIPIPGFWQINSTIYSILIKLRDDLQEFDFSMENLVLKVEKDAKGTTLLTPKQEKIPGGGVTYSYYNEYKGAIPNFEKIWAVVRPREHYEFFVDQIKK